MSIKIENFTKEFIDKCHFEQNGIMNKKNNDTILHYACFFNSEHIYYIIQFQKYNTIANNDGDTPLHFLAMTGNVDMFNILSLYQDVNPFAMNKLTQTPMTIAMIRSNHNILFQYIAKYENTKPLYLYEKEINKLIAYDDGEPFDMNLVNQAKLTTEDNTNNISIDEILKIIERNSFV
jgi:ankyrin repeat protein